MLKPNEQNKLAAAAVLSTLTGKTGSLYDAVRQVIYDGGLEDDTSVKEWESIRLKVARGFSAITETRID